jgi:hypothetical protein
MYTRRLSRAFTIAAALMISATVSGTEFTSRRQATNHSKSNAATPAQASHISAQEEAALGRILAGTWVVNVSQPGFPPAQRHFTFNSDGGLVTNDDLQVGPNFVEHFTIAQGNWIRTGNRSVAATIVGQRFNLEGSFLGTFKVRMNLQLNPLANEWSGTARIDIALPGGQVIFTSDAGFEATRLAVEPL